MEVFNESSQIKQLNETLLTVMDSLPLDVEQSVYYNKLKQLLHSEIFNFCKDQNELKHLQKYINLEYKKNFLK